MIKVYKIPDGVTRDDLVQLVGSNGTVLNPIEDINGNLVVSTQEFENPEFDEYKSSYPDLMGQFLLVDYYPKKEDLTLFI